MGSLSKAQLDAMVEKATVDCYNEDEQATGLFTLIEDNLAVPFATEVLGVSVTVESVDLTDAGQIVAICTRDRARQAIPIVDLSLPTPPPEVRSGSTPTVTGRAESTRTRAGIGTLGG